MKVLDWRYPLEVLLECNTKCKKGEWFHIKYSLVEVHLMSDVWKWCDKNCKERVLMTAGRVYFESESDRTLFILRWG